MEQESDLFAFFLQDGSHYKAPSAEAASDGCGAYLQWMLHRVAALHSYNLLR